MVTEAEIHRDVFNKFVEVDSLVSKTEVPLFLKKIDIVTFSIKDDEIKAYEVKIRDWKRAFQQAKVYSLCADKTYVILWHEYAHRVDLDLFQRHGIGIYKFDGKLNLILESCKNTNIDDEARFLVKNYIMGEEL